jgi:putative endonuclease
MKKYKKGYVYIMSNKTRSVLYIGVTSDLKKRVYEHYSGLEGLFTHKYNCKYLVYFEEHDLMIDAIAREKQLKNWKRAWKLDLIKSINPQLRDLKNDIRLL